MTGNGLDFSQFEWLTFDCYGTLIDWETGILAGLRPLLERQDRGDLTDARILELFSEFEPEAQGGGFIPYRAVLRSVVYMIASELGFGLDSGDDQCLRESFASWPAFEDTPPSLQALQSRYKIGILSNVDDVMFEESKPKLGIEPDLVVTSHQVQGYKPNSRHFEEFLARSGASKDQVLHVAESFHHDIAPAKALGWTCVHVNRRGARTEGASRPAKATPDLRVPSLAELVRAAGLESEPAS